MSERESSLHIEILLVEDNPGDVVLTRRALKSGKCSTTCKSQMTDDIYHHVQTSGRA